MIIWSIVIIINSVLTLQVSTASLRPYLQEPVQETPIIPLASDQDDQRFRNESAFETSKTDGFADDNSTGTLLELESLQFLKQVLFDFRRSAASNVILKKHH